MSRKQYVFISFQEAQANVNFFAGTPLHIKGTPKPAEKDIVRDLITETTIYECIASPHPEDITKILNTLLKTPDVTSCLQVINSLKATQGLALADIITALGEELTKLDVPAPVMITWLDGLAEVEYRLSGGGGEVVQTGAVIGVVRSGAELMGGG
jgi:replication factor C subunit 3/5